MLDVGGPIDRNYCLDAEQGTEALAAQLVGPNGLTMEVWTDQPGLQVFTGANIASAGPESWWHGKGARWQQFGAICSEPHVWLDASSLLDLLRQKFSEKMKLLTLKSF